MIFRFTASRKNCVGLSKYLIKSFGGNVCPEYRDGIVFENPESFYFCNDGAFAPHIIKKF